MTASGAGQPTDAQLVLASADGDHAAFELLYRRHAPWLRLRLRQRCADRALVDDVLQETFLSIWRGTARFEQRAGADVAAWLWRIGSRRLIDTLRSSAARDGLLHRLRWRKAPEEPSAEDLVLRNIEHGDLAGSLARLSPELRAVIQATVVDGLSSQEAAILLGIPVGTVKTRASRARRQLREGLA